LVIGKTNFLKALTRASRHGKLSLAMTKPPKPKAHPKVYTTGEAAQKLGLSTAHIHRLIENGDLVAFPTQGDGKQVLIDAESLLNLLTDRTLNPPKRGRKPKEASSVS
jgi:excisionase family DNA binding protein